MSFAWLGWYTMSDEQYLAELERRKNLQNGVATEIASIGQ
jgi:hypothetical protein